jgi:hypothetical protein
MSSHGIILAAIAASVAYFLMGGVTSKEMFDSPTLEQRLRERTQKLVSYMQAKYPNDFRTQRLASKDWNQNLKKLAHNIGQAGKTINKNIVYVCTDTQEDDNTAFFVVLHELAHVVTCSIGHEDDFWDNMRFLIDVSIRAGLYSFEDYRERPKEYCGQPIRGNPYSCVLKSKCKVAYEPNLTACGLRGRRGSPK